MLDVGIGAGVRQGCGAESTTFGYGAGRLSDGWSKEASENTETEHSRLPWHVTTENVMDEFGANNTEQDTFAAHSS